jgi:hypothetical protein
MQDTKTPLLLVVWIVLAMEAPFAGAQNLLTNGNFEASGEFSGWMFQESVVGMPGLAVDSIGQQNFANRQGEMAGQFGLWLKSFAGHVGTCCDMKNFMTNGNISQTVPGMPNEQYTFSGWSRFEQNYPGGVDTLDPASPGGAAVPSPTDTSMLLEFLDSGGSALGSPVTLDVRASRVAQIGFDFANDNNWYQHTLTGMSPANTASVRVTAQGTNMVFNVDPSQTAFMDDFSLTGATSPGTQLLSNGNLNMGPPELDGWTLVETGSGTNQDTAGRGGNFADDPATEGNFGYWVKGFNPGDATLSQRVDGVVGGNYTFTASSAFGQNYSGGTGPTKPTALTLLELAFLDSDEEEVGTPVQLDIWDAGQRNAAGPIGDHPEAWDQYSVNGVAPAGTEFVEVRVISTGTFATMNPDQGAFFDDLSLTLARAGLPGDYNANGTVDAADYVLWRNGGALENEVETPGMNTPEDYNAWRARFGNTAGGGSQLAAAATVPEPATSGFAMLGLLIGVGIVRGRRE